MLHAITWSAFARTILVLTILYYLVISLRYYRRELFQFFRRQSGRKLLLFSPLTIGALMAQFALIAQTADGNNGLSQANTMVRSYFDTATQLMYAIGALMGLIGAIRVFTKPRGHDMGGDVALWFAGCIFLVVAATVLKSFFGL